LSKPDDDAVRATLAGNTDIGYRIRIWREHRGMHSGSDLARAIWGSTPDPRGYDVAKNRDTIWRYEKGKSRPSRKNLIVLATALRVLPEDIDPVPRRPPEPPPIRSRKIICTPKHKGLIMGVEIDADLPPEIAAQIVKLVEDNDVTE